MTAAQIVLPDGTWIDNFRIVRRLGRGGFGVTYLAEEFREWEAGQPTGSPLRMVAMKEYFPRGLATRNEGLTVELAPDVEGAETTFQQALKGFFQEAESLMRFDHPNVIKIHRVFRRNSTAYYVMPFLKGESLRAVIKRDGAMGEERARRLMMPVIDGLIHAHARGILHRDIKPENVMVPDEGGPVLIDFGAARAQAVDADEQYTRYSELVAYTPGYAALEQYHRATRENPHGAHTDVYGIAAVMYHCVTGEAPVESSKRALEISNSRPDPLTPASSKLMDTAGYGRAFLAAIDWGLELAGKDRPQTLADFRRALEGRHDIPQTTLSRLERYGVSTEPFTRVVTTLGGGSTAPMETLAAERRRFEAERKAFEEQKANTMRELERQTAGRMTTSAPASMPPPAPEADAATELLMRPGRVGDTAPMTMGSAATQASPHSAPATAPPTAPPSATPTAPPPSPPLEPLRAPVRAAEPPKKRTSWIVAGVALIVLGAAGYLLTHPGPWTALLGGGSAPAPQETPPTASTTPPLPPAETATSAPPPEVAKPEAAPEPATAPAPETKSAEPPVPAKPEQPAGPSLAEREGFEAAKASGTLEGWRTFKKKFPKSELAAAADIQIATLEAKARAEAPPPPQAPAATTRPPATEPKIATAPAPAASTASQGGRPRNASAADCAVCPELVTVPGGTFQMGDVGGDGEADERPVHTVTIAPMKVGRYEVTFDEWDACVAAGGCSRHANDSDWGRGRRPVINVNWSDANQYLQWLSQKTGHAYRLPTEAEAEYLNRAGSHTRFPWGDDPDTACKRANVPDRALRAKHPDWTTFVCDDGFEETAPVGSFPANAFGLYDVSGNVWEWTQDCYQAGYRDAPTDGSARTGGDCKRRIIRGGSWGDAPTNLRSSDRTGGDPGKTYNIVGFRVVRAP